MQRHAKKLLAVDDQIPLIPETPITSLPVSLERIYSITTPHDALLYACEIARENGKPIQPKQIYGRMGKDATRWSRITSGEFDLPSGDIIKLCKTLGNDVFVLSINQWAGYDLASLRRAQDDKDKEIDRLRSENAELKKQREIEISYWREMQK